MFSPRRLLLVLLATNYNDCVDGFVAAPIPTRTPTVTTTGTSSRRPSTTASSCGALWSAAVDTENTINADEEDDTPIYFTDLGLCPEALTAIEEQHRWYLPTPIQQLAIPRLLGASNDESNDSTSTDAAFWCQSPTGSGKTAAFVLPLLQRLLEDDRQRRNRKHAPTAKKIRSLILCPTRELATQIGTVIENLAQYIMPLNLMVITGGVRRDDQIVQLADWIAQGQSADVVVATPGRLVDVLTRYNQQQQPQDSRSVDSYTKKNKNKKRDSDYEEEDWEEEDDDEDDYAESLTASEAALERRLLKAMEDTNKDSLTLDVIQKFKLDRDDDEGRLALNNLLEGLEYLVLDEADRLLGRAFESEINAVLNLLRPEHRVQNNHNAATPVQTWLFSATFPKGIEPRVDAVLKQLGQRSTIKISCANSDRLLDNEGDSISATLQKKLERSHQQNELASLTKQSLEQVGPESTIELRTIRLEQRDRTQALKQLWLDNEAKWSKGGVLVFVSTRYAAEHVSRKLKRVGIQSSELHGKLDQDARVRRLADLTSGKTQVLIATDLASRGLDVVGLSAVVNYDLPRSTTDFVHRVGRTGRAGRRGEAITFVTPTTESHFDLIERRHIAKASPREMLPGFQVDEDKWNISAEGTRIRTPGAGPSANDLAHDRMFGGIKGTRRSKKDRLREQAAKEAASAKSM